MANESSFDIVCKADFEELRNAVQHAQKEIANRFDFKNGKSSIALEGEAVSLVSDDEFKLEQVRDVFETKLVKRGISLKAVKYSDPEAGAKITMRQTATFQKGLAQEDSKKIVKLIKDLKLKAQLNIQGEQVRVSSKSKDELQACMQAVRAANFDFDCQFSNFR